MVCKWGVEVVKAHAIFKFWTFNSWGVKTYVFEFWTFNSSDLLKYGIQSEECQINFRLVMDFSFLFLNGRRWRWPLSMCWFTVGLFRSEYYLCDIFSSDVLVASLM